MLISVNFFRYFWECLLLFFYKVGSMAVFILVGALSVWPNLGKLL